HDLWSRGGADALANVDGLYTLVRYDAAEPSLTLLSDRYGSRRLFVHDDGDAFVFAADFAAVLAWVGRGATVDRRFVEETVCLGSPLRGATWVNEIRLFEPASERRATIAGGSARRYWSWSSLPEPGAVRPHDPVAETYERWREVLSLRCAGERVGQQLSGGLDSRLILAEGSRLRERWPSLTYGVAGSDEVRFAARAARVAKSPWTLLDLPGPDWLDRRVALSLENGGFLDLLNAHPAGRLSDIAGVFRYELSGFAGDATMGETFRGIDRRGVLGRLPYWSSPVSLDPEDVFTRIEADIGQARPWGYIMDTKVRRSTNGWPHLAVPDVEVRKPFLDYVFLEFCAGLPAELRSASRLHIEILRRYFPAFARVPIQRTGVRPGAPSAARLAMAAVRRIHKGARVLGLPLAPWIRGAFDTASWMMADTERQLRETLLDSGARVRDHFDPRAIDAVLNQTFRTHEIAHEIAFNLLRVEHTLRQLPAWMQNGPPNDR
ncbi:MAG: asparagine synthase-related protein, partial [Vicinamibacterales bacterium]